MNKNLTKITLLNLSPHLSFMWNHKRIDLKFPFLLKNGKESIITSLHLLLKPLFYYCFFFFLSMTSLPIRLFQFLPEQTSDAWGPDLRGRAKWLTQDTHDVDT